MPNPSAFSQEWRDCLCAHYMTVVRNDDTLTERTLHGVMIEAGFREDELKQLYVRATAHVDDVGVDFVPDMDVLEAAPETFSVASVGVPEAAEPETEEALAEAEAEAVIEEIAAIEGEVVEVVKDLVDEEQSAGAEATDEIDVEADDSPEDETPDEPSETQLSLF